MNRSDLRNIVIFIIALFMISLIWKLLKFALFKLLPLIVLVSGVYILYRLFIKQG